MSYEKGKKNKLNLKDKVQIKAKTILWHVTHIVDNYSAPDESTFYKHEVREQDLYEIGSWIYSHQTKKPLYGKVVAYGAEDQDAVSNKEIQGLMNVKVEVLGKLGKFICYFSERNLKKVK